MLRSSDVSQVCLCRSCKIYVEGKALLESLQNRKLEKLLDEGGRAGVLPESFKLSEGDRLVFYFQDLNDAYQNLSILRNLEIKFRGPAQDVFCFELDDAGRLKEKVVTSNDVALGGYWNLHRYELKQHSSPEFLENYLKLCLYAGKSPQEPYLTSFVYFVDLEEKIPEDDRKKYINEAERGTGGYPVVYVCHLRYFSLYKEDRKISRRRKLMRRLSSIIKQRW